jgi:glucosyl-3-phosphoglycerate phosphatase
MYFLRHGESEFNRAFAQTGRDPGIIDAPVTTRGSQQAEGAAKHFLNLKNGANARMKAPVRILSSPYTRALQTAAPIAAALGLKVEVNKLLGERRLYSCDIGTPCAKLKTLWPSCNLSSIEDEEWWPSKEESQDDNEGRAKAFLALTKDIAEEVLVVSHWYFIFTLSGLDLDNCQILWRDDQGKFHRQG